MENGSAGGRGWGLGEETGGLINFGVSTPQYTVQTLLAWNIPGAAGGAIGALFVAVRLVPPLLSRFPSPSQRTTAYGQCNHRPRLVIYVVYRYVLACTVGGSHGTPSL